MVGFAGAALLPTLIGLHGQQAFTFERLAQLGRLVTLLNERFDLHAAGGFGSATQVVCRAVFGGFG